MNFVRVSAVVAVAAALAGCGSQARPTTKTVTVSKNTVLAHASPTKTGASSGRTTVATSNPPASVHANKPIYATGPGGTHCPAGYGAGNPPAGMRALCIKGFGAASATDSAAQPQRSTSATPSLNCEAGGFTGTLVGTDVCQYVIGPVVVSGPAGAYLSEYALEPLPPCSPITHDAHWSNGMQTEYTQPSYDEQTGQC